jgi:hypothetical protein
MISSQYKIFAFWGSRPETPEALAARFTRLIDQLTPLHPAFGDWTWVSRNGPASFESWRPNLTQAVAENVARSDWGNPQPNEGYTTSVVNNIGEATPHSIGVMVLGGSQYERRCANSAEISTGWRVEPEPSIVTYAVFKPALLALAETYDVDWCAACPQDLIDLWPRDKTFCMPWMCYIKPAWAPLITPPKTAIVEHRPNGALFMSATDETFVTANPAHLAVARDIEAALAPLNALPENDGKSA